MLDKRRLRRALTQMDDRLSAVGSGIISNGNPITIGEQLGSISQFADFTLSLVDADIKNSVTNLDNQTDEQLITLTQNVISTLQTGLRANMDAATLRHNLITLNRALRILAARNRAATKRRITRDTD